jgi:hypothetical protein
MAHDEELSGARPAYGKQALFADRMIGVRHRDSQWVPENSRRLLESNAVNALVTPLLIGIPCEAHL